MDAETPIGRAVKEVGSQSALARAIGVSPQAVQQWLEANRVPAERVLAVESATDGKVTRHDLRPDVFGPAPSESAAA
jgi:DNA-binding transcriptional regulator YdaS (Cro superfamily)